MKRTDITNLFPEATDEQIKTLMDINGADVNNARKNLADVQAELETVRADLTTAQKGAEELQSALDTASALREELESMKSAEALRLMKEGVANETGVPVNLLTMDTEEALKEQAEAIKAFATPRYPSVRDGGEVHETKGTAKDHFKEWAEEVFN